MKQTDFILKEIHSAERQATKVILEAEKMKQEMTKNDKTLKDKTNFEDVLVPFSMVEMTEKVLTRTYKKIIYSICAVFAVFVITVFGFCFYLVSNYDISTYSQDIQTGNANYIGNDGDIINGETDYKDNQKQESQS